MQLQTNFDIPFHPCPIDHSSSVMTIGSCFSTVIGQKLKERKFKVLDNPFGTLFNPLSLLQLIDIALGEPNFPEALFLEHDARHLHYSCHSSISGNTKDELKSFLEAQCRVTKEMLSTASLLVITFGTANVYEHRSSGMIVSNCHKQPAKEFKKKTLSVDEIKKAFSRTHHRLKEMNPDLNIVLTVSPVRHTKDGIPENQLSKSILRVACDELVNVHENLCYFPSYEIMMDELRDYRFYKDDLIHPSTQAEVYIWEKFSHSYLSPAARKQAENIMDIKKALAHRPFNPSSAAHQKFLQNLLRKMEQMPAEFDFTKEIKQVNDQLLSF
ncbi:GSCFA domain-containing protein [Echinicola soli]|uniref:GSCFA domain-containing protein n=1 Tax=Echinicola soli TaxID=2591634 RepID=A0A514CIE3_9BACT|nr:GSCFA domain-containing protein [Echinicola soli]QDH79585.1 GSCFA domain-containing protein [Echinicola soli]